MATFNGKCICQYSRHGASGYETLPIFSFICWSNVTRFFEQNVEEESTSLFHPVINHIGIACVSISFKSWKHVPIYPTNYHWDALRRYWYMYLGKLLIVFQITPEKMFEVCFACKGFWKPRVIPKPELWNGKPLTIKQQIKPLIWVLQLLWYQSISDQGKSDHPKVPRISRYQQTWIFVYHMFDAWKNVPKDILYKKNGLNNCDESHGIVKNHRINKSKSSKQAWVSTYGLDRIALLMA